MMINRLTTSTHFIPIKITDSMQKLVDLDIKDIVQETLDTSGHRFESRPSIHLEVIDEFTKGHDDKVEF